MTELQLQEEILIRLNTELHTFGLFWSNPMAGFFDTKRQVFRKHVSRFAINGVSDILGIYRGKFYAFEVKLPKEKQWWENNKDKAKVNEKYVRFQRQQNFIDQINQSKGYANFVSSIEDCYKIIQNSFKDSRGGI